MVVEPTIALFAKYPRAGQAKTRLAPLLGADGAAQLHRRLVERTLETMRDSGLRFAVYFTGGDAREFAAWLGDDVALVEQGDGDLGARLARVEGPAIVLGADIPGLTAGHLRDAAKALEDVPVVIGPASDGGYYLIGFTAKIAQIWEDIPWGTETVLKDTKACLNALDVPYRLLEELSDCDRPEDLAKWPELLA